MSEKKAAIKAISRKNGLILGGGLILLTLLAYFINWDIFLKFWFQILKFVVVMSLAIRATAMARSKYFKKFSFRDGFSAFFIAIALGTFLFFILTWLLFDLIDHQAGQYINDSAIKMREEQLEAFGLKPEAITQEIEQLRSSFQFSFVNQLKGYITNLVLYCIPAILVALIFKTKKPIGA